MQKRKKNSKYFKGAYNLIDFEDVVKVAVLGTDETEIPDSENRIISIHYWQKVNTIWLTERCV